MSHHSSVYRSSTPRHRISPTKSANPQASVSLVFAEPEHAVSGGSAAATLPPQQLIDTDHIENPLLRKQERRNAASLLRRASCASLNKRAKGLIQEECPAEPINVTATNTGANVQASSEVSTTISSSPELLGHDQSPVSTRPFIHKKLSLQPPQYSGWFSSLSRKSRASIPEFEDGSATWDESLAARTQSEVGSLPQGTTYSSSLEQGNVQRERITIINSSSEPILEVTEVNTSNKRGWFSGKSAGQRTPIPTTPAFESVQSSSSQTPLPPNVITRETSLVQDIPQRKPAGKFASSPPGTPEHPPLSPRTFLSSSVDDNVPTLSSFTPPSPPPVTSVRPRERTQSNLSSLNPSASRFVLSMPLLGRPKIKLDQVVAQVERAGGLSEATQGVDAPIPSEVEKREEQMDVESHQDISRPPSQSGWWGYIKLGSQSSVAVSTAQTPDSPPLIVESTTLDSLTGTETRDVPAPKSAPAMVPSVMSTKSSSSWYVPWRWYQEETTPTTSEPADLAKTQAELVKEEALARSESLPPLPIEPPNPVIADVENRASWISFFSKSVSNVSLRKVKEAGEVMEVMHLDDEDGISPPVETSGLSPVPNKKVLPVPNSQPSQEPPAPPLTKDDDLKAPISQRSNSASSRRSVLSTPSRRSNLVLPTFEDTFDTPPRSIHIPKSTSAIRRTIRYVSDLLFPEDERRGKGKSKDNERDIMGRELPRTWGVLGEYDQALLGGLKGVRRVVVIGIHGWFPGSIIRQVLGEPTGTSHKFANMLALAVEEHFTKNGGTLEKLTKIVLEGEGTIERRVNNLYQEYLNHEAWVEDLKKADAILLATHSQGSIVSTQLLSRLIDEGHIRTAKNIHTTSTSIPNSDVVPSSPYFNTSLPQRVLCLAICGIHLGPLLYLNTSSLVNPYIQYFESAAARELFEFQDSDSPVSKTYMKALTNVLGHGIKFTYIASLDDQVVPIYSGSFCTATHPLILRALYIDGDAYNSSDFLSNLLVLLLRIRNAGLDDGGLITHLSEATAGSLSGVGHSSAYEEPATYALAVRFLFETSDALGVHPDLEIQPFTARAARNDYEIPWALRDLIANPDVASLFASEFSQLRTAFDDWHPRTTVLRDLRRKLEPIRRLRTSRL